MRISLARKTHIAIFASFLIVGALSFNAPPASAGPIEDLQSCYVFASRTSLSNFKVTGYGGSSSGCSRVPFFFGTEVCLDYNGVTEPLSCRQYPPGAAGPSNPVACKPGLWMTQVTPLGPVGPGGPILNGTHSFPPDVYTISGCLNPA